MEIEFDPAKDAANIEKHGISLSRAADLELLAYVEDHRVAGTDRDGKVRVISLRRARPKEMKRYV